MAKNSLMAALEGHRRDVRHDDHSVRVLCRGDGRRDRRDRVGAIFPLTWRVNEACDRPTERLL